MKIKPFPILLSIVFSATVLFGGWFLYQTFALASPLQDSVSEIEGIERVITHVDQKVVKVDLTLAKDANLREVVNEIQIRNADLLKKRSLQIKFDHEASHELDHWWSRSLFDVAEAMETKRYGDIPDLLEERVQTLPGLAFAAEMDEENVYIRLNYGDERKFIILPRVPAVMEVWSNERVR